MLSLGTSPETSFDGGHPAQLPGSLSLDFGSNPPTIEEKLSELVHTLENSTKEIKAGLAALDERVVSLEGKVLTIEGKLSATQTKANKNERIINQHTKPNRTLSCCKTIGWTMLGGAITVASVVGYDLFAQYQLYLKEENS